MLFSTVLQSSLPAFCRQHEGTGTRTACPCFLWGLLKSVKWEEEYLQWDISRAHSWLRSNASTWPLGTWEAPAFSYMFKTWVRIVYNLFTTWSCEQNSKHVWAFLLTPEVQTDFMALDITRWRISCCKGAKTFCRSSLLKVCAKLF